MHILFLSDNFPPEVNAPATRTYEHAREWVRLGHRVTVVTCAPNFPQGRVFPGYRNRPLQRETLDGIEVLRVWSFIARNEGFVKRTLDYASYMASATLASPWVRDVDVIVGTSPQFFTACAAAMVARLKRRPWVFEVRDLWPESIVAVGALRPGRVLRALEALELRLYRDAARIVVVTDAFRERLVERGVPASKIVVVPNGIDASACRRPADPARLRRALGLEGKLVVGYIGTHGLAHGLDFVLRMAAEAAPRWPQLHFLFVGDGAEKPALVEEARRLRLSNVTFHDLVPKERVGEFLALIDIGLVPLRDRPTFRTVLPSKIFEYAALGVPVLLGVDGEARRLVEAYGAGLFYHPENSEAFLGALARLVEDPALRRRLGEGGRALARAFDRRALAQRMLSELCGLNAAVRDLHAADTGASQPSRLAS